MLTLQTTYTKPSLIRLYKYIIKKKTTPGYLIKMNVNIYHKIIAT